MTGLQKLPWVIVSLVAIWQLLDTFSMLRQADSAPQQAAVAAMGAFYVITCYVLARAGEALSQPTRKPEPVVMQPMPAPRPLTGWQHAGLAVLAVAGLSVVWFALWWNHLI